MGFRTVVILNNDNSQVWGNDPNLGKKISHAMNFAHGEARYRDETDLGYGRVVQCSHADQQTIGIIDGLDFTQITHDTWRRGDTSENITLRLVKAAAEKLGFRLVKISKKAE